MLLLLLRPVCSQVRHTSLHSALSVSTPASDDTITSKEWLSRGQAR